METRSPWSGPIVWLPSLALLAACQVAVLYEAGLNGNEVMVVGMGLGYLGIGIAATRMLAPAAVSPPARTRELAERPAMARPDTTAVELAESVSQWLAQHADSPDAWPAFDQFVRELLSKHCGAERVRCYELLAGNEQLRVLSAVGAANGDSGAGAAAARL